MKARRKSDGKIIEVREWRGASDVIYSSPDMNRFYQASELDFNVDAEDTVISGWVCRDNNSLNAQVLIGDKPKRTGFNCWENKSADCITLPKDSFPDLTWHSGPEPVEIIIKIKKK